MLIAIADLAEAEGRSLRHWTVKVGLALGLLVLMVLLATTGVAFLIVAIYLLFASFIGNVAAALVTSASAFLIAGGIIWTVLKITR